MIRCSATGLCYIGVTTDSFRRRSYGHLNQPHKKLREAVNEHGRDSLEFFAVAVFERRRDIFRIGRVFLRDREIDLVRKLWANCGGAENSYNAILPQCIACNMSRVSFENASSMAQSAGIKSAVQYRRWIKPDGVPTHPQNVYTKWTSWADFLGTKNLARNERIYFSFEEARSAVAAAGIKTSIDFFKWRKPYLMPSQPRRSYPNQWVDWPHFLGQSRKRRLVGKKFIDFHQSMKLVRQAGIKNKTEFRNWKRPKGVPAAPDLIYFDQWVDWPHFLGNGAVSIAKENHVKKSVEYLSI